MWEPAASVSRYSGLSVTVEPSAEAVYFPAATAAPSTFTVKVPLPLPEKSMPLSPPCVHSLFAPLVTVYSLPATTSVICRVEKPVEFVAFTAKRKEPSCVGVPERMPVLAASVMPSGSVPL